MKDLVLGIETSCDETAAALVRGGKDVLSSVVASQISRHAPYGGVVPELAAREHLSAIGSVVDHSLDKAGCGLEEISAVAVTNRPGLLPALLVGVNFAKGLGASLGVPVIGVNHFLAHVYAAFLHDGAPDLSNVSGYPVLSLIVSGGHTAFLLIRSDGSTELIGSTLDDAAGEALDKAAKLLGLGYPGGPVIEKTAKRGDPARFSFPRPLTGATGKAVPEKDRFNFSFSGLKTSLLYQHEKMDAAGDFNEEALADTAAAYQEAVVDVLCRKSVDAVERYSAPVFVLCGGVACNTLLRERMAGALPGSTRFLPAPPSSCTDNAAMIAGLGYHYYRAGRNDSAELDAFAGLGEIGHAPFAGRAQAPVPARS